NGPGGVCASPVAAGPADAAPAPNVLQSLASPAVPDQPLPPGAPASLGEAMRSDVSAPVRSSMAGPPPELSTPSTGLSAGSPITPKPQGGSERAGATEKRPGRAHPMKPVTAGQIAEFCALWNDAAYSNAQIARRYRCGERTILDWRRDFGLPTRPEALKTAAKANSILGAAAAVVDAASDAARITTAMAKAPVEGQVVGTPRDPDLMDPMKDKEIIDAMNDLRSEARIMSAHSDLTVLQRKLSRLSVLVATKAPLRSWDSLQITIDCLARGMLRARQVEAMIPRGEHDPVQLRKEAAGQLMKELQSVMTPEEQAMLARLVKSGADRLMAKGGSAESIVAGVEE
ncbi:MAG TPA: hypothetical protein VNX15_11520, partial [Gemmatimonadales bacterium]|nr:hypothetical protein [Gemmatimonadales bacterium]